MIPMLSLLLAHPATTLRYLAEGVIGRHYASAEEFGVCQDVWRELRVVRVRFS